MGDDGNWERRTGFRRGGDFLEKDFSTLCRRAWLYRNKKMRASGLRAGPAFLYFFCRPEFVTMEGGGSRGRERLFSAESREREEQKIETEVQIRKKTEREKNRERTQ